MEEFKYAAIFTAGLAVSGAYIEISTRFSPKYQAWVAEEKENALEIGKYKLERTLNLNRQPSLVLSRQISPSLPLRLEYVLMEKPPEIIMVHPLTGTMHHEKNLSKPSRK
jgi:hypothetical protein